MELKRLSLEDLMNVQVMSVSRSESTVGDSPAAIFVITPEMIRRSGVNKLPDLFRMVPGMDVANVDSSRWAISVRGLNERFQNKLLVQVDGRTVYTPINAGTYWDAVDMPLEDIERIEIVRGPGASVWGANAVNGIINIITKPAKDTQKVLFSAGGGSEESGFATFRFGGQIGDQAHFRVYGKWREHDAGFNSFSDGRDDWRMGRFGFRLDWAPNTDDTITLQGDYFHGLAGRRDLRAAPDFPAPFIRQNTEDEETSAANVLGRWTHKISEDSNWTLQVYYDYFSRRGTADTFNFSVNTGDIDFQHQFALGERQKVVWGTGYRINEIFFGGTGIGFDDGFAVAPDGSYAHRHLFSAFVQDEIALVTEKLFLTLGSKFEHNDYTGFEYQPTGRLLWKPAKNQTVWGAVSRAVRTPSHSENELIISTLPAGAVFPRITRNSELAAEALIAYELGYRAQATERIGIDAALFFHDYDRLFVTQAGMAVVDPESGALTLPLNRTNGMDGEIYGVEIAATWNPTEWWRLSGQYTWKKINLHADRKLAPTARTATEIGGGEGKSAENQFYIRSSFDLPGNVEIDVIGRYVDELDGFVPEIEDYGTIDVRIAWKPKPGLELAIVGQNLLDPEHPENGTSALVRSPLVEVERSIYAKVTWEF